MYCFVFLIRIFFITEFVLLLSILFTGGFCVYAKISKSHEHRFQNFSVKMLVFSYPSVLTYVLGAQKNRLIETVLLSTHNICFG